MSTLVVIMKNFLFFQLFLAQETTVSNVQGIFRLVELTVCDTVHLVLTDDPTTTQFQGQDITEYDQYLPMHPIFGNIHSND